MSYKGKRTYQPSKTKRTRKFGFRARTISPFPMRRSLSKIDIIRRKQDIDRIFKQGRRVSCKGMRLMILENTLGFDRFIVVPARRYGNSVQRNRIRRQMKEIFRLYPGRVLQNDEKTTGRDIALVVYPGKVSSYSLLESDFHSLLGIPIPAFRIRFEATQEKHG